MSTQQAEINSHLIANVLNFITMSDPVMSVAGNFVEYVSLFLTISLKLSLYLYSAFIGSGAFLIAAGFITCDWRWEAVLFLSVANGFLGLTRGGCMVNHVDFGRR